MGWEENIDRAMKDLAHLSCLSGVAERKLVVESRPKLGFKVYKYTQTILNRIPLHIVVLFEIH
jgi:hypothetical protein